MLLCMRQDRLRLARRYPSAHLELCLPHQTSLHPYVSAQCVRVDLEPPDYPCGIALSPCLACWPRMPHRRPRNSLDKIVGTPTDLPGTRFLGRVPDQQAEGHFPVRSPWADKGRISWQRHGTDLDGGWQYSKPLGYPSHAPPTRPSLALTNPAARSCRAHCFQPRSLHAADRRWTCHIHAYPVPRIGIPARRILVVGDAN